MYAGGAGGNGNGVASLGAKHLSRGRDELREHQRGGGGRGPFEVVPGRRQGAFQGRGEGKAPQSRFQGLQAPPVILARYRSRRQQRLGRAHHQPQSEQAFTFRSTLGRGDEPDEPFLRRRRRGGQATRRSTAATTSAGVMSAKQRWCPSGQLAVPVAEQGRQSSARSRTSERAPYGRKPNCATVGPKRATTGVPTPVAMCITPVSPDTTTRARSSRPPVSWSEHSPAALIAAPAAASCCASPRSSGPPTTIGRYPDARSRSASALQCATGQRLVAWAAPGASAATGTSASPRSASHCAARSRAPGPSENSGGPPSGCASSRRAASKYRSATGVRRR